MSQYSAQIAAIIPSGIDPRHVEAYMRLEYSTLDHLSRTAFVREVHIAVNCMVAAGRAASERLAQSFGL